MFRFFVHLRNQQKYLYIFFYLFKYIFQPKLKYSHCFLAKFTIFCDQKWKSILLLPKTVLILLFTNKSKKSKSFLIFDLRMQRIFKKISFFFESPNIYNKSTLSKNINNLMYAQRLSKKCCFVLFHRKMS